MGLGDAAAGGNPTVGNPTVGNPITASTRASAY